ncbi:MAG: coenzyme F420 hydrogenase [Gemmatimonadales bacterium]|nr:MAG: coenzyme F420 hydrogenase [Gemmatimonadales bacterium]
MSTSAPLPVIPRSPDGAPLPTGDAPGTWTPTPGPARPRSLCTDCGISRSSDPGRCGRACQFINPRYDELETRAHGRPRDPSRPDELHFGPFRRMVRARMEEPLEGAQWTGITTSIGARLLSTGAVDAVLTMGRDPDDRWAPRPMLVTEPEGMVAARGMKMGYAPLLSLLEPALEQGWTRLAVIGIPCQVHALRALEEELGLEALWVVGTPCSDNTTTARFHDFLARLSDRPQEIEYLEFRADYRVEIRFEDGETREIPFLDLPISDLPSDFFPLTCRTCVDYTNALADVTVGYMGGQGDQWLIVRNERGEALLELLGEDIHLEAPGSSGRRAGPVKGFLKNLERASGGLPTRRMPRWLRPLVSRLMPVVGPSGLEFARARLEMKALETVTVLRNEEPRRMRRMIPPHVWKLAEPYGLGPEPKEIP